MPEPLGIGQKPVEIPGVAVVGDNLDRHMRGDCLVEIQIFLLADDLQADFEILAHALVTLNGDYRELIFPVDRSQFGHAVCLLELSLGHEVLLGNTVVPDGSGISAAFSQFLRRFR